MLSKGKRQCSSFCGRKLRPQNDAFARFHGFLSLYKVPLLLTKLEAERVRKAFNIPPYLFIQSLRLNTVQNCQVEIQHYRHSSDLVYVVFNGIE